MRAGIALGSNLGDRHAQLQTAVLQLKQLHEEGDFLCSSFYETAPEDCPPDSLFFLNATIELDISLPPLDLLNHLQEMEVLAGRSRSHGFHTPRNLDLDILYYGQLALESETLRLPHPRIRERYFVLAPLAEIRPDLILPGWSKSAVEYLLDIEK